MSPSARKALFAAAAAVAAVVFTLLVAQPDRPPPRTAVPTPSNAPGGADRPEVAVSRALEQPTPAPPVPPRRPQSVPAVIDRDRAERAGRVFAGDWLDYLAGQRPVSAVRRIRPALLVPFAGGDAPEVGPGRSGLGPVSCLPAAKRRFRCTAAADGQHTLRFVAGPRQGRRGVEVVELALD